MNKETKTSKSFWTTAFESEISTLFDASEKSNIITNIVGIINKNNIDTELLYKNFYDIIVVLKTQYHDNRNLYKAFMNHLQDRYVDHWDFTNKYKKEDVRVIYESSTLDENIELLNHQATAPRDCGKVVLFLFFKEY